MRPRTLEEFVGQQHLLAPGKPLRTQLERDELPSAIFWGPPGSGKTTLARIIANRTKSDFVNFSAVLSGIKEIKAVMEEAARTRRLGRRTILFVDEIHRFNKAQQDAFLPYVERGDIVLIGATTENPSFEVNSALLSRAAVYVLHPLSDEELGVLFERAKKHVLPLAVFADEAKSLLVGYADGDARRLLNMLEQLATAAQRDQRTDIGAEYVQNVLAQTVRRFDKGGDAFYDQISALHKSVRGSNPDAALYWMCRMLDGGADPRYIGRRLTRMAVEDIGLADPRALRLALDACEVYERLGTPEGELALAEAAVYLACTAKSNAVYMAYNDARRFIREDRSRPVPEHLRNAPTKLMKEMGFGKEYRYAHDEPEAYAAGENYFPEGMPPTKWYEPTGRGLEAKIAERLKHLRELDKKAQNKKPKN